MFNKKNVLSIEAQYAEKTDREKQTQIGQKEAIAIFGYIICNKKGLSKEEWMRYQELYCGVCKGLEKKFGQTGKLSLSYDMTFLALFLTALYQPMEEKKEFHCPLHPLQKRNAVCSKFTDYAADMTIALAYHKCLDDWEDEHKKSSRKYGEILKKKYEEVKRRYPRQCENVESCIQQLGEIEKSSTGNPDKAVNCSGRMLSEIFVYEEDFWSKSLRSFGYELGRFIYLMDAIMDYQQDVKKGNYNPLLKMGKKPEEMEEILTDSIGNATREFEKMPFVEDAHLIRNILYGGVWQKYYAKFRGKESNHG